MNKNDGIKQIRALAAKPSLSNRLKPTLENTGVGSLDPTHAAVVMYINEENLVQSARGRHARMTATITEFPENGLSGAPVTTAAAALAAAATATSTHTASRKHYRRGVGPIDARTAAFLLAAGANGVVGARSCSGQSAKKNGRMGGVNSRTIHTDTYLKVALCTMLGSQQLKITPESKFHPPKKNASEAG